MFIKFQTSEYVYSDMTFIFLKACFPASVIYAFPISDINHHFLSDLFLRHLRLVTSTDSEDTSKIYFPFYPPSRDVFRELPVYAPSGLLDVVRTTANKTFGGSSQIKVGLKFESDWCFSSNLFWIVRAKRLNCFCWFLTNLYVTNNNFDIFESFRLFWLKSRSFPRGKRYSTTTGAVFVALLHLSANVDNVLLTINFFLNAAHLENIEKIL